MCNDRGDNCASCSGSGHFNITTCPKLTIDRDTVELMKMVRAAEHHLPLAGGMLDQTQSFTDALDWIDREQKRWQAED